MAGAFRLRFQVKKNGEPVDWILYDSSISYQQDDCQSPFVEVWNSDQGVDAETTLLDTPIFLEYETIKAEETNNHEYCQPAHRTSQKTAP